MQLTLLLTVAGLLGCNDNIFVNACTVRTVISNAVVPIILLNHKQGTVTLTLPPPFACPNGNPIAKSVVTEVFDSANRVVEHTKTTPGTDDSAGYTTSITFTPSVPGSYYLTARFEPSIGAVHRDLSVAEDHTGDKPFLSNVNMPAGCAPTVVTDVLVLCQVGSTVSVVRPTENKTYTIANAPTVAYAQPSLWVWGGEGVTRYEDLGSGGFEERETLVVGSERLRSSNAIPTSTSLLLFSANSVDRYLAANGAITRESTPFSEVIGIGSGSAVSLRNDQYGVTGGFGTKSVCQLGLGARPPTAACTVVGEGQLIADGAGFWAKGTDRTVRYGFANGLPTAASLAYLFTGVPRSPVGVPYFENSAAFLTIRAPDFRIDAFPKPMGSADWRAGPLPGAFWEINERTNLLTAYRRVGAL